MIKHILADGTELKSARYRPPGKPKPSIDWLRSLSQTESPARQRKDRRRAGHRGKGNQADKEGLDGIPGLKERDKEPLK